MDKESLTTYIKSKAKTLGFDDCGIAEAKTLTHKEKALTNWLSKGYNGKMQFLNRNIEKRLNPRLLLENAKSVIIVLLNYYTNEKPKFSKSPRIAKYAYGKTYHTIIKNKLHILLKKLKEKAQVNGAIFVDSAPILEKAWAERAGLAWQGKNAVLINKNMGSFFFLGELLVDIELNYDKPFENEYCGNCTKCIDACPTNAIVAPKILDARKCISYHTIENRGEIPNELKGKFRNYIYGCDICQDVCPWNSKAKPHSTPEFKPNPKLLKMNREDWLNLSKDDFDELFKDTEVKRGGYQLLKRNIDYVSNVYKK